jgi:hypothetical protein
MLLRCLLDPWNVSCYSLPFLLVLMAWEVHAQRARLRVASAAPSPAPAAAI